MEAIIGEYLRKVAIESIEEATDTEIKMKLKNEIDFKQYKNKNLPVGVTVSYDMRWTKHSSDNRYDSILGHTLMIGCLAKILLLVLFLVSCTLFVQGHIKWRKAIRGHLPQKL